MQPCFNLVAKVHGNPVGMIVVGILRLVDPHGLVLAMSFLTKKLSKFEHFEQKFVQFRNVQEKSRNLISQLHYWLF